jgi:curved DNA-binding protein CbpA
MGFVDYYEILEVSPNASLATIERVFRELARRYHPDNQATGDRSRFDEIIEAHETLRSTEKRTHYDREYKIHVKTATSEASDDVDSWKDIGRDADIQDYLLSVLYIRRRTSTRYPGIGNGELSRLSDCPEDHLEFHLWYLKEKGWIQKGMDGLFAITVDGVERANSIHKEKTEKKLITDQS